MTRGYLVQYGRSAFVGRFAAPDGLTAGRGDRVVVRTPRGVELGEVLCEAADRFVGPLDPSGGELLRPAGRSDESEAAAGEDLGRLVVEAAEAALADLPLSLLDAEVLLDRSAVVLHALPWDACDADPILVDLSARFGLPVRLLDVSRIQTVPEPATGCDKPDCGTGSGGCTSCGAGGGCSTGSCSRGTVKSADELTAYFAGLRQQMEARSGRTPLA